MLLLLGAPFAARAEETKTSPAASGNSRPPGLLLDAAWAGDAIVAVGERGLVVRSTDHARSWQAAAVGSPANVGARPTLTGVAFSPDGTRGWAVGHDALILSSDDAGTTWRRQFQGENLQESFLDVLAIDRDRAIAVGAYALYLSTGDGGKTWQRRKLGEEDYHFNRLTRGPTGTLYLAGEHGTLLRSSDLGAHWTRLATGYEGSFYGVLPLDRRTLIAHGLGPRVFRSEDDGATWETIAKPQVALFAAGVRLRSGLIVLGGQARALALSRDDGKTLVPHPEPFASAVAEFLELKDGRVLALGEAGASVLPAPQ
jgi:photosystem II stability/assembly factor-like uncharacterized protein